MVDIFKGYNHNLRIGDGEFYDMKNLSSDNYPVLSLRHKRGTYAVPTNPQGLVGKDFFCYVDGGDFVINGLPVSLNLSTNAKDCPKTLISMGSYVIIMPDKKYVNTLDEDGEAHYAYGDIEKSVTKESVTFTLTTIDGVDYDNVAQESAPTITDEMKEDTSKIPKWIDTSKTPHTLKQYSTTTETWTTIATTYIKISATGIGAGFNVDDGVTIEGVESTEGNSLADLNGATVILAKGSDYIVVTGIIDKVTTQDSAITVSRKMPIMDFIIESGNRLWGCRYGTALNGEIVNEIYASKLGDFKNWNCFQGISTDSYVASVGTDGRFTGAITYNGFPIFFKENCMHKVYGYYPANYQIQATACRGVQKGCERSLAIVNEILYYKSSTGVCAYDGSLPVEISSALGDMRYENAVAGSIGNKYYISMADTNKKYHLFVFDTAKNMWHREDDTQVTAFCNWRGDLYYIDHADNQIKTVLGTGVPEYYPITWQAVTGIIGTESPDKKYISRMDVRMSLQVGTRVVFYVEYDSCGEWEHLFTMAGTSLRSFAVPIRPKRCDHMRLRIEGYGDAKIYSICKTIEQGSDV
jgi:hypothetical protein